MVKTLAEWQQVGNDIQDIQNKLTAFICNPEYQELFTRYELDCLDRAFNHIDKFRCRAENRMIHIENPPAGETHLWLSVFYSWE